MKNEIHLAHPLRWTCTKFLCRHKPKTQRQWLQDLAKMPEINLEPDCFGEGQVISQLENRMAKILGKERALFFHKGMVGQLCCLKQYAYVRGCNTIAVHPQSHIQVDESLAYNKLLGLEAYAFGRQNQAVNIRDIKQLPAELAAVTIELPTRHAGFQLPKWDDLIALHKHCQQAGIPLHFDGARLFESAPFWDKTYQEVAGLSDSVYVSLYKSLGGMAGGIIAGESEFIESLLPWKSRFGGDINMIFPFVLSGLWGIEKYLPNIPRYCLRAAQLYMALTQAFGEQALPYPVWTNAFVMQLPVPKASLDFAALDYAQKHKVWLFDKVIPVSDRNCMVEIQVGDGLDSWSDEEVVNTLLEVVSNASTY